MLHEGCGPTVALLNLPGLSVTSNSRRRSPFPDCVVLTVEDRAREYNRNHEITLTAFPQTCPCPLSSLTKSYWDPYTGTYFPYKGA